MLGRDVVVALTTEDAALGASVSAAGGYNATFPVADGTSDIIFAGPRVKGNLANSPNTNFSSADTTVFGTQVPSDGSGTNWSNEVSDLTGVDIGIGATDEDISTFGIRTAGKVEVKKETTLSLTRKKKDNSWDIIFNAGRHGVEGTNSWFGYGSVGSVNPGRADYGYRVFLKLKDQGEVMALPNCCITGHTVTLNADGTTEETLELMCYVEPIVTAGTSGTDPVEPTTVF